MATDIAVFQDPKAIAMKEVELDSKQAREWMNTRAKIMMQAPGFTHVLYKMMNPHRRDNKAVFTEEVPIAATDGLYMFINPKTYFNYTIAERTFAAVHEILHCVLNHPVVFHMFRKRGKVAFSDGTTLPYVEDVMQQAADYIINDMIVEAKIGQVSKDWLHDPKLVNHMDSLTEAYRKVYKATNGKGQGGGDKRGVVLAPGKGEGKDPTVAEQQRSDQAWKTATAAALEAQKAQGNLPGSMQKLLGEILNPQVSWQEHIKGFFRRRLGGGSWDWRRPDRRLISRNPHIYAPARSGFGAGTIVIAIDSSGSVFAEAPLFLAEVKGVLEEVNPQHIYLVWCDAAVNRVDEIDDYNDLVATAQKGAAGGGGTRFEPVFEWVQEQGFKPDALLYLTDGLGSFPKHEPDYPVLWGSNYSEASHYPWGEVVMVPKVKG